MIYRYVIVIFTYRIHWGSLSDCFHINIKYMCVDSKDFKRTRNTHKYFIEKDFHCFSSESLIIIGIIDML